VDRRRIRKRIIKIKKEIEGVRQRRERIRKERIAHSVATVAIIGYTNAGKSTLLNNLTQSNVMVDNKLFSTLDLTSRQYILPNNQKILFVDTVGFIHKLPHNLIEAFKATMEEVQKADLLLHVLDISSPKVYEQLNAVYEVLKELKSEEKFIVTALNKIDLVDEFTIQRLRTKITDSIPISALQKRGFDGLVDLINKRLSSLVKTIDIFIPHSKMGLLSRLYEEGKVIERKDTSKGVRIKTIVPAKLERSLSTATQALEQRS
jgi:GTP-binding protein HflX